MEKIETLNKKTWGWAGCKNLQPGQKICLSKGDPPMPAPVANAICGPQVPGTMRPTDGTALKDLNPCPLSVCCNVWGQCGLTRDFCVPAPADTGAPGTSKPGANGCIASCGNNITNNGSPPASFAHVAYFEAWNQERECLTMDLTDIDIFKYTHIHFAFGDITPDFRVSVAKVQTQFDKLVTSKGPKRILSFGGWAFSNEAPTYTIFRTGVLAANRNTFAQNVVDFIVEHDLDGVDFDWEYPAAPDLVPGAMLQEGKDYLEFLKAVKRRMPADKTVSIAAPASYWYLKGFPIKEIGAVVDYIIYMTYDLHGQWDYGNKWTSPGCPGGNCLRSHVNITETHDALAMITKAGVNANKVFVGITSYGRSFHMADPGCTGVHCKFTGSANVSNAEPGRCTGTSGYLGAAEIRDIIWQGGDPEHTGYTVKQYHDKASNSDILVYNEDNWVAWMSDTTKATRIDWVRGLNFGGVSDWAVDLDRDWGGSGIGDKDLEDDDSDSEWEPCDFVVSYRDLEQLADSVEGGEVQAKCAPIYAVQVLKTMLDDAMAQYEDVNNGYDGKFASYSKAMKKSMPELLRSWATWNPAPNQEVEGQGQKYFDCDFDRDTTTYKGQCPVPRDKIGPRYWGQWELDMKLRDKNGFEEGLGGLGISPDWVEFGDYKDEIKCWRGPLPDSCLDFKMEITGYPKIKADFEIPNPKDIMTDALPNLESLKLQIAERWLDLAMGIWDSDGDDVVEVLSVPVFLLKQAVESMAEAKEIGEDVEEEERKNLIMTVLTAVLCFVPVIGQYSAAAAGMVATARAFVALGAVGGAALTIVDIVENPESAPMAIAGLLMGGGGRLKGPSQFANAAKAKSAMTPKMRTDTGAIYVKHDDVLRRIIRKC
jgi:GH18 family chitinase